MDDMNILRIQVVDRRDEGGGSRGEYVWEIGMKRQVYTALGLGLLF